VAKPNMMNPRINNMLEMTLPIIFEKSPALL